MPVGDAAGLGEGTMGRQIVARLVGVGTLAAAALLSGAGAAHADPPPGWDPGEWGVEYDFADVSWMHHGRYNDALGNWHTGWLTVEEDDDGVTGEVIDWWCPAGVEPPTAYDPDQTTTCTRKGYLWLEYIDWWDVGQYDQARNRIDVHLDVPAYDSDFNQVTTVRVDVMMKGLGKPEIISDESGEILNYSESFQSTKSWGKVNGHRIGGPNTVQGPSRVGFWLDGWERTT
jgi:hypothetical protein